MKKGYVLLLIPVLLSIVLIICTTSTTTRKNIEIKQTRSTEELEYGRLVFIGGECVGWFSQDLSIIGSSDMKEYFQKNKLEPTEPKVLNHFAALGWKVVEKNQKDKYTTEYRLKREKPKSYVGN